MSKRIQITVGKHFPSGALELSTIHDGQLIRCVYYDYTKREAMRLFRAKIKQAILP